MLEFKTLPSKLYTTFLELADVIPEATSLSANISSISFWFLGMPLLILSSICCFIENEGLYVYVIWSSNINAFL